jgi:hypothetical protein
MSDESSVEISENQQEPETAESGSDDPAFAAMVKRYGLTPQQTKESTLYL